MKVSVIIVSYNVRYFLEVCLASVCRALQGIESEIIVVDNASADDSVEMVQAIFPAVKLILNSGNAGFSKANNQGVAIAKGEYVLFLNPDTVMPEDFFSRTLAYMDAHPQAGALGPRLIDGSGRFAPDGKKSFPTLSVALTKALGLGTLFPKSRLLNKYYAVHIGELETAPVEVLSGCCMLVRQSAMEQAGGAFDEAYFMYCEDVDLSFRIIQSGYQNIYFPEASLIHYKGESTRKSTVSYVRIFNEALATFVRKHYSSGKKRVFLAFLQAGIFMRAVLAVGRNIFRAIRMPLLDALLLLAVLFVFRDFWVGQVKNQRPLPTSFVLATFPAYVLLWVGSLYLNGTYDQPYRPLRVVRGMLIGSVLILAYFGLLPAALRYSRGLIVLSGITGTVVLLGMHELLSYFGIFNLVRHDEAGNKAVIVATHEGFKATTALLRAVPDAPEIQGRISPGNDQEPALGGAAEMPQLLQTAGINEVIFCSDAIGFGAIMTLMQSCGPQYQYRIHLPESSSFVGSQSSQVAGKLYTTDRRYVIGSFEQQRNKRLLDFCLAAMLLLLSPVMLFRARNKAGYLKKLFRILAGKQTFLGYDNSLAALRHLPHLKPAALPVYNLVDGYKPSGAVQVQAAENYALHYTPGRDLLLLRNNWRWIGAR